MLGRYGTLSEIPDDSARRFVDNRLAGTPGPAQDEIHIWMVELDRKAQRNAQREAMLAPSERVRATRFRSHVDAHRFVERRTALREILGGYLRIAPAAVAFNLNEFGKPSVLASETCTDLSFNTSHSGALALIAVGRSVQLGIDIELQRSGVETLAIAAQFFAAAELASLAALGPHAQIAGFFNAWTRKEAVVKALGGGLSIPLNAFEVSLRPGEDPEILRWDIAGGDARRWRMHHLEPASGYVGALAVDSATHVCRFGNWAG